VFYDSCGGVYRGRDEIDRVICVSSRWDWRRLIRFPRRISGIRQREAKLTTKLSRNHTAEPEGF